MFPLIGEGVDPREKTHEGMCREYHVGTLYLEKRRHDVCIYIGLLDLLEARGINREKKKVLGEERW